MEDHWQIQDYVERLWIGNWNSWMKRFIKVNTEDLPNVYDSQWSSAFYGILSAFYHVSLVESWKKAIQRVQINFW